MGAAGLGHVVLRTALLLLPPPDYNPLNSYANSPGASDSTFVPMHWCSSSLNTTIPGTVDWLLGA